MQNQYKINYLSHIPLVEVWGAQFTYSDLYELIGKNGYMTTFIFKQNSEAWQEYGQNVTKLIFYSKDETNAKRNIDASTCNNVKEKIKIDSVMPDLNNDKQEELKYGGILVSDIKYISYISYKIEPEFHNSGEKIVPNVIYVPYEGDQNVDYDILYQNYIAMKLNSGTELIQYEKEKFIGIILRINNNRIDSRLLRYLGFDLETIRSCDNIWYHLYKAKERRSTITEEEKNKLADLTFIRKANIIIKMLKEIKRSGINSEELAESSTIFETIIPSLFNFEPAILLYGKKQIYWDIDSYLHIIFRHIKDLQIGYFKNKSSFPYKFEDLRMLIEKVLGKVKDEIKKHFEEKSGKDFKRVGKMSVFFNDDYYSIQIDKQGRLVNIYINN